MKFSCESTILAKEVNIVKKAIASSPNAPIFSGIHLILQGNALEIIAMDVNFFMSDTCEVQGEMDGDILVPARSFSDLLAKFDKETIYLEKNDTDTELNITSQKGKYSIPLMEKDDYPPFPEFAGDKALVFPEDKISDLIKKTIYACSTDESRPLFTGVLMEKKGNSITCVGTNTHRLAIKTVTLDDADDTEYSMIIPSRLLKEIANNLNKDIPEEVELSLQHRQIQVKIGALKIISSLIEGSFPNYRRVVPPTFSTKITFTCQDMEKAVQRVSLFSTDDYNIVRMTINQDNITLTSGISDLGQGKEVVDCTTVGDGLNIAFNSKYIMDILKNAGSEGITMEMNNSLSPACLRPLSEEDYLYIVTPVRVIF